MSNVSSSSPAPAAGLTLVFNGAEARLQIIAGNADGLVFSQEWFTPRQGMQVLTPALMDGLKRMGKRISDISRIAIVRGPGSFTGLRLVLSTALGLARPLSIPMAGIGYMDALAADPCMQSREPVYVVTHARRGQVHWQGFAPELEAFTPAPLCPPQAGTLEEALQSITEHGSAPTLLGTGIHKNLEYFTEALPNAVILPPRYNHPAPETLLDMAQHLEYSQDAVEPLYIRGCDAEESLASIVASKGIDPEEAQKRLKEMTSS